MDLPSGVVSHAQLQGVTIDQHHAQLHAAQHLLAGTDPLSSVIRQEQRVRKASSQSVTSSTTLVDDADLQVTVVAGQRYILEAHLWVSGAAAGGFKMALNTASGGTARINFIPQGGAGYLDTQSWAALATTITYGSVDTSEGIHLFGTFVPVASGTMKFQFAQGTSNGTPTVVAADSYLMIAPF